MCSRVLRVIGAALLFLVIASVAIAAPDRDPRADPPDEDRFLSAPLPDIALTTAAGARVALSAVARGRPLLFTFVFTRCGGVCSPFLASWRTVDRSVSSPRSFHRLVLTFDPRDTAGAMAALAHHLGLDANPEWTFAIAAPPDVERLTQATGFWSTGMRHASSSTIRR